MLTSPGKVISSVLKHDAKVTSYKIALLRAINDVVLAFPDMNSHELDIAVPLRVLALYWIAYYWPFVDANTPIFQGPRTQVRGEFRNDMSFRPQLTALRIEWEKMINGPSKASDGFFIINEIRVARRQAQYSTAFHNSFKNAISAIVTAIQMPIRYAGPKGEEWSIFERPLLYSQLSNKCVGLPGTMSNDLCLVIPAELWATFQSVSLWVEALCIHEWCLFSEGVAQNNDITADRGNVYRLLTDRPDNRIPLSWERNHINILLAEGHQFTCPWSEKIIRLHVDYALDHILPVSIYPINELWNLVPSDPKFNSRKKRDRLPSIERLQRAVPYLTKTYETYGISKPLNTALRQDVNNRFSTVQIYEQNFAEVVSYAVVNLVDTVGTLRNLARF